KAIIRENIAMTKEADKFQLLAMEARQALNSVEGPFDLVFLDPPYAEQEIEDVITELCQRDLLADDVMVVCETDKAVSLPEEIAELGIWKEKLYGISKVTVYVR
ncbi:RsmD family RNA methyltransferase, partial [Streptococcus suis]|uniref:RsmD family RNA methyltransferase n=1 Tax=Streptococcus suis TaxID=1307 RepID=UPI0005CE4106